MWYQFLTNQNKLFHMKTNPIPNVVIVDDHLMFRQGLKAILSSEEIANVIAEASNGKEFINALPSLNPDIVLMDIDMPYMDGMKSTQQALELIPDLKIVALTMFSDEEYYYKMVELGVKGFVLKSTGIAEVEKAIHVVMGGESYFSNEILTKIIQRLGRSDTPKHGCVLKPLTEREVDVLRLIMEGLNTDEIASSLNIGSTTVKSHRSSLLEKTGCKNAPSLILYAIKNKLIEL